MTLDETAVGGEALANILQAAASAVAEVLRGRSLTEALGGVLPAQASAALRGGTQDLAYGTLRDYGRGDHHLGRLLDKPLTDPWARALLLVALHALEADAYAEHTLVSQAVEAVAARMPRFKGLANAVLRRFLRERSALVAAADADAVARWRHPAWWMHAVRAAHPQHWQAILAAGNSHPPMGLRVNRRREGVDAYLRRLAEHGIEARAVADDAVLLQRPLPVGRLPGFAEGLVSVQDAGAQRAVPLLDLRPGLRVLDACAAPGGKSAHLLELADVDLLALDLDAQRCQRISDNLTRLGLTARVMAADCRHPAHWWDGVAFDRILADVPCSASGVVRRHPDAKWLRRAGDIARFAQTQQAMLAALWPLLARGGRLVYVTCSVFPAEGDDVITAFTARHPDVRRIHAGLPDGMLLPDDTHDGFYYAVLEKA